MRIYVDRFLTLAAKHLRQPPGMIGMAVAEYDLVYCLQILLKQQGVVNNGFSFSGIEKKIPPLCLYIDAKSVFTQRFTFPRNDIVR